MKRRGIMTITYDRNYKIQKGENVAIIIDDNGYILKVLFTCKAYRKSRWKKKIARKTEWAWWNGLLWN